MPEAQIISLADVRAAHQLVTVRRSETVIPNPQEKIKTAADMWLCDSVLAAAEETMRRLLVTDKPLEPNERARLMRASAALLIQPEA